VRVGETSSSSARVQGLFLACGLVWSSAMSASPDSQLNHMELDSGQYNEGLQDGNWNPQEPSSSSGKQECLRFASESAIGHWKWSAGRRRVRPDSELFQHGSPELQCPQVPSADRLPHVSLRQATLSVSFMPNRCRSALHQWNVTI